MYGDGVSGYVGCVGNGVVVVWVEYVLVVFVEMEFVIWVFQYFVFDFVKVQWCEVVWVVIVDCGQFVCFGLIKDDLFVCDFEFGWCVCCDCVCLGGEVLGMIQEGYFLFCDIEMNLDVYFVFGKVGGFLGRVCCMVRWLCSFC